MKQPVVGEWRGLPRWQCPACAYDSMDKERVLMHMEYAHPEDAPVVPTTEVAAVTPTTETKAKRPARDTGPMLQPIVEEVNNGTPNADQNH